MVASSLASVPAWIVSGLIVVVVVVVVVVVSWNTHYCFAALQGTPTPTTTSNPRRPECEGCR